LHPLLLLLLLLLLYTLPRWHPSSPDQAEHPLLPHRAIQRPPSHSKASLAAAATTAIAHKQRLLLSIAAHLISRLLPAKSLDEGVASLVLVKSIEACLKLSALALMLLKAGRGQLKADGILPLRAGAARTIEERGHHTNPPSPLFAETSPGVNEDGYTSSSPSEECTMT
jgi:hypothetical protein